ncbi:hypothetical protein K490DRAFT_67842 [Saccharata proteae CBS 121410]|uniref:RRM domain-containing protein n=1 Tax=Saccharata proteae CBS 121410 TaxID=1314787 RepID=A0A9P4LUY8_9PEZI|nr:hypothetical protein K490DRAFT_67842 [Saccharata proteae CBS 121410]
MNTRSPPAEPPQFRGQTLTPVSPKPLHFPQPANIPVLENQMDPIFNDTATHYPPESHQDNAEGDGQSSTGSLYAEQPAETGGGNGYAEPQKAESGEGAHNHHDTSAIQTYAHPTQDPADAPSDAAPAPNQAGLTPSFPYDPYAGQESAQSTTVDPQPTNGESGGVDFQALLDNLAASDNASPEQSAAQTTSPSQPSANAAGRTSPASALPVNPNLPPRPPPQDKPNTHPNYTPGDDIRSYHPHSQTTTATQYRNQSQLPQLMTAGATSGNASGGMTSTSYQQTPVSAMPRRTQSPTPSYRQRDSIDRRSDRDAQEDEAPWAPEVQKIYDEFLAEERVNVTEGQWDKFPVNSRLFIGNLPTEKVTKRDLFHIFHRHGKLAQISIKQAYGFVQFFESESCFRALKYEQGQNMRGRKMHLEISKPQRNTNRNSNGQQDQRAANRRRSRSPDYTRGGNAGSAPRGVDRYTGGSNGSPRGRDDGFRRRDDYRPGRRSPSPRGWGRRDRSRDRYDGRRRSRSRSPYGRRYRSPSPQRNHQLEDDLPLPRRKPDQVPDVQILVPQPQDTNRDFMAWVERGFTEKGVTCDVLLLSQKLDEGAVVRRQIVEGVLAISRIVPRHQETGKIALQIFNRSAGADKVSFEEYDNLDPSVCAQLVLRAKANSRVPPTPQYPVQQMAYGMPQPSAAYGMTPAQAPGPYPPQPNPAAAGPHDLTNAIANLDSNGLQKLLATIQPQGPSPQQQASTPSATTLTPDLSRMFGKLPTGQAPPTPSYGQPPSYPGQAPPGQQQHNPYAQLHNNPALASLLGGQLAAPTSAAVGATPISAGGGAPPPQQQGGMPAAGQTDMQEIMAQLAKYRR